MKHYLLEAWFTLQSILFWIVVLAGAALFVAAVSLTEGRER